MTVHVDERDDDNDDDVDLDAYADVDGDGSDDADAHAYAVGNGDGDDDGDGTELLNQITYRCRAQHGDQDLYVKKIVIVWLATDTKQLLNGCQVVENKIGVINHCLVNLICMLFLMLRFMK